MKRMLTIVGCLAVSLALAPGAQAQGFDTVGTRAAGMSGAFVAVADDASAAYWNPAGFASGSYFSLVLDRTGGRSNPEGSPTAGSRSGFLLALGAPALGLSYYRLRDTRVAAGPTEFAGSLMRVSSLVTHHAGATLVQSIVPGISVGATLKLVRGVAATAIAPASDRETRLDEASNLIGRSTNKFDLDLGVMATTGYLKAGLTVRNLTEPEFKSAGEGVALGLERQVRAGVSLQPTAVWLLAADFDLLETDGIHGPVRDFAVGAEARVVSRATVRAGVRTNTSGDDIGQSTSVSGGASYAVRPSILLDAQFTSGSKYAIRGWGLAARFVY